MTQAPRSSASPLEAHLGFWLRYVSNYVSARFETLLAEEGVSPSEWVALRTLLDQPETTTAALIEALGMTKGAASKVVSRLEDKGLAKRQLAEGSGREQVLLLTRKGVALVPKLAALADQNEEYFFAHMNCAERRNLMKQFQGLVAHHKLKQIPVA
jgi:DNA-binding MarR family transcriptional regulator